MSDGLLAGLDTLHAWQATAAVLAVSFGSAVLLELVGVRLARRLTRRTKTALDDIVFEELRVPLVVTVALAGIYVLTRVDSVATATLVDARTLALFFRRPSLTLIVLVWARAQPRMRFRRFGDSALEYELLCWVNGPTRAARARHELNRAIYHALTDAGIEIPYPRSDVTLRSAASESDVTLDDAVADGR